MADTESWINIDLAVMGGKPCIRNLRITVDTIIGLLECGHEFRDVLANYPDLTEEDLAQAVIYHQATAEQRKIGSGNENSA